MIGDFSLIDWHNIVLAKKNVRSKNNVLVGKVIDNYKDDILVINNLGDINKYKIPKGKIKEYNGSEVLLNINSDELKKFEIYEKDLASVDSTIMEFFVKGLSYVTGSVKIRIDKNLSLVFDSSDNKINLNIIDPSFFDFSIGNIAKNKLTRFLYLLKDTKVFAHNLAENNLTLSVLNKNENVFTLGKNAHPSLSKLITRSNDIQIDSLKKSIKLASDINKDE